MLGINAALDSVSTSLHVVEFVLLLNMKQLVILKSSLKEDADYKQK